MIYPHYQDVPLAMVRAVPKASHQRDSRTVLIYPRGETIAEVEIPKDLQGIPLTRHLRSRWARLGIDTDPDPRFLGDTQNRIGVILKNRAHYGVMVRQNDIIVTLANSSEITNLPLVGEIPLHAGNTFLWVDIHKCPRIDIYDGQNIWWRGLSYIDPHTMKIERYVREVRYHRLDLIPDTYVVLPAMEKPVIPDGCIGIVKSAVTGLEHAMATIVYPGSHGTLVLEFWAIRQFQILPGMHVATLTIYQSPVALPVYEGTNGRRLSVTPSFHAD